MEVLIMTRETLQPYISMADMLARTFGKARGRTP